MLALIIVLLVLAAVFGGWGHGNPSVGPIGWSPFAIILVVLVLLWATGNLGGGHLRL